MRYWRMTENNNVAIQTGSTYISESDSMTSIVWIPTANLGFSTTASSQNVSTGDCNIERQPEIAISPPKQNIIIPTELQQIAWKFQCNVRDFRPWRTRIKYRQMITTTTDNRKWQYWLFGRQSWNTWLESFAMVECRRFAVGILMIRVIVSEIFVLLVSWLSFWIFDTR